MIKIKFHFNLPFNYPVYPLISHTLFHKPFITTALRPQRAHGITPANTTINKSNRGGFKINFQTVIVIDVPNNVQPKSKGAIRLKFKSYPHAYPK